MTAPLPPESQEPVLQFAFAKRMGYRTRMRVVTGLVVVGLALQAAWLSVLPGIPLLAAAVALSWVVGFDNGVDRGGMRADEAWRRVPFERVEEIVALDRRMKRWDASALDVTSGVGCVLTGVLTLAVGAATIVAAAALGFDAALIVGFDGSVLVLLQFVNGMRTLHRKPDLVLKAGHLRAVVEGCRAEIDGAGTLHGQLLLAGAGDDAVPRDARLLVDLADPPGRLLSVQGQVVLNRVGGSAHPYFYCVVIADAGAGLLPFAEPLATDGGRTTIEVRSEGEVDIVVVRQTTSRTSGYHTKEPVSRRLMKAALDIAVHFREAAAPVA